ncbi:hypothetical protein AAXB25_11640 [Paenibacillus lautus]|uniref:hypothetical protein n=1 Tax=Paenibacillus lautus TaxID=1401 RepID=UPI003D2B5A2B
MEIPSRIQLTGKQFFVLTGIVGARAVIGLEDPFSGTLTEEMPIEVAKIEQELQEKDLIDTGDSEPVLVQELLEYIEVCSRTLLTIHMRVSGSDKEPKECFIYYSSSLVVKADIDSEPDGERVYVLEALGTPSEAWLKIINHLQLEDRKNRDTAPLAMPKGWFQQWMSAEQGEQEPRKYLLAQGYSESVVSALADCVSHPERYATFTAYYCPDLNCRIQGIELLRGQHSNWLIRNEGEQDQIWGATVTEIIRELGAVIERIKCST